jgi:uncharacterized protein YndB with AHSA1/START domain
MLRLRDAAEEKEDRMTTDTATPSGALDITNEVRVRASRERVYDALCAVGDWWPHRFRDGASVEFEPRVGGRFFESWGGSDGALYGTVTTLVRPERITVTGPMGMTGPVVGQFTYELTPELTPDGEHTVLRCTHRAFGDISDETVAGYVTGWPAVTDALEAYLTAS